MTRTVGRHERKATNRPALSFHSRGRSKASISLLASSINSRRTISLSRSCPANRPAKLRKSNYSLLSRCCRLAGLLNSDSRPLIENSVRRAGSNSPPRSDPRSELRRGPEPNSVHSFFVRFERPWPGAAGFRKVHFSGRAGIFAASRWSYPSYLGVAAPPQV
jgi:hypothetical protein